MAPKTKKKPRSIDGVRKPKKTTSSAAKPTNAVKKTASIPVKIASESTAPVVAAPAESVEPATPERISDEAYEDELEAAIDSFVDAPEDGSIAELLGEDEDKDENENIENKEDEPTMPKSTEKSQKSKNPAKKSGRSLRIISGVIAFLSTGLLVALLYRIFSTNILPIKYIIAGTAIALIFSLFFIIKVFRKKTRAVTLIILDLIGLVAGVASVFGYLKIDETMAFLSRNLDNGQKVTAFYYVIAEKSSEYNSLDDIKNKEYHALTPFNDATRFENSVKSLTSSSITYVDDLNTILEKTIADNTYLSILSSGVYDGVLSADEGEKYYEQNLKIVATLEVEVDVKKTASDTDLTKESFLVYLAGIDTREEGKMPETSLTDVNIILAVNPKEKHILMVAIPRDYYITLHGTSSKNKLTHAGSYGGIALSRATIEDLFDLKFDHYVRVNFQFVVRLVDAVDGIDVYSDPNDLTASDYNILSGGRFRCWTEWGCIIEPGWNHLDGKCALGFARERHAYKTGDRHRGENQEQVIKVLANKITSSTVLISKYSDILNALDGTFETSLTTDDIISLANMQIDNMSPWKIESYNVNGRTGTATISGQNLSVMYPDLTTVETAKKKIQAVLDGVSLEDDEAESKD